MKKITSLIVIICAAFFISGCSAQPKTVNVNVIPDSAIVQTQTTATSTVAKKNNPTPVPAPSTPIKQSAQIPAKFVLDIAFAQQAPFGNWDKIHEETCEEASMIMVDKYFAGQQLNETIMEAELQKIIKWENDHGYKVDLTAQETVDVLKAYFGLAAHLSRNVTADQIKYEISQGNPVIIPAAGRLLGNPNFTGAGPLYHMLVVKGYNSSQFITNDPGTRNGNNYAYSYNVLINAIHDWNSVTAASQSEADMVKGEKVIIVVDK